MSETGFDLNSIPPEAISSAISKLTENPDLLTSVASAFGAEAPSGNALSALLPMLGGSVKKTPEEERRDALLCALKPYLSTRRCEAIDYMLKFGKFGDIFKKLK